MLKSRTLFHNARVHTQADRLIVDSLAVSHGWIVAVGNHLDRDPDFSSYQHIDLKGCTVTPGFVDAHTHFYYFALSLGRVWLDGLSSLQDCLDAIRESASGLKSTEWLVGEGYSPDRFRKQVEPDRYQLDEVSGKRPAFVFSRDQHSAWVNSTALKIAGIDRNTPDPDKGEIVRFADGTPTGILREQAAYDPVFRRIKQPSDAEIKRRYTLALEIAYSKGVTGVHSVDGEDGFRFFRKMAKQSKLGLRVDYFAPVEMLPELRKRKMSYGWGDNFLRLVGIKIFADGSLGSRSAFCFQPYAGSKNYGIETTTRDEMKKIARSAAKLGLPCAIHAIGDRAISNVLDVFEQSPALSTGARHRIEHLQLLRRKDIVHLKRLGVVASVQPSHCPSDIHVARKYWGKRAANAYPFRLLLDRKIDLAFGSDVPIEPLDPIAGIAAAVCRARPRSRDVFYPEQRITASEALYCFTAGSATAAGQAATRGFLLPGYAADLVVLDQDITRTAPTRIRDTRVLATIIDGNVRYCHSSMSL
jgi:predicted amidohydrolase YtcJ